MATVKGKRLKFPRDVETYSWTYGAASGRVVVFTFNDGTVHINVVQRARGRRGSRSMTPAPDVTAAVVAWVQAQRAPMLEELPDRDGPRGHGGGETIRVEPANVRAMGAALTRKPR
jgi:hypothetical protein